MRYLALATDYDGTLAHEGITSPETVESLKRLRCSGRKIVLVTGRRMEELRDTFDRLDLFDLLVLENGALLYNPATKQEQLLAEPPSAKFVSLLHEMKVEPLGVGRSIVATWEPQKEKVLDAIQSLGLELQVIFNKGAVMVLPSGVNKASGLQAALRELLLSPHNTVGVGDAENDHAFLSICECAVAVSNALPALKERADFVTVQGHGEGVQELIAGLLKDDLAAAPIKLGRHDILIGQLEDSREWKIPPHGENILVAGTSGGGKSTLTTGIMERLIDSGYQICVIDPEGDYQTFAGALLLGDPKHAPTVTEIVNALSAPGQSVIVNLLGFSLDDRPTFFQSLLPRFQEMRAHTGRPHWLIVDEAHHLLPSEIENTNTLLPEEWDSFLLITLKPDHVAEPVLRRVNTVIAVGENPADTLRCFGRKLKLPDPVATTNALEKGKVLVWQTGSGVDPFAVTIAPCRTERVRHSRKYAEAELTPDRSFFFRGPESKLNLRAPNLITFLRLMEGVDEETWLFHLAKGEYSQWFRNNIKNEELAEKAAEVETGAHIGAEESRKRIRELVEQRYTLSA